MNPLQYLIELKSIAKKNNDPLADFCILTTNDFNSNVYARTIQLHSITDDQLLLIIDRTSPKYLQLNETAKFELLIVWNTIPAQIRIQGIYIEAPVDEVETFWQEKDHNYKILDLYHAEVRPQSEQVSSKEALKKEIEDFKAALADSEELVMPDSIAGLSILPERIEFWEEEEFPFRTLYTLREGEWDIQYLTP